MMVRCDTMPTIYDRHVSVCVCSDMLGYAVENMVGETVLASGARTMKPSILRSYRA